VLNPKELKTIINRLLEWMRWAGNVALIRDKSIAHRILVGKPEGKRPLGKSRRRWVNNIKMDPKRDRIVWYELERSGSGWRSLVNTVMKRRVP
jgi:hypothetical protein